MTRWYQKKKQEHFYKKAKHEGYRARSAFKLKQIQNKYQVINQGDTVLDLGAAPGGWSQVASEIVGENGTVIGIDISPIKPLKGVRFLKGDLTKNPTIQKIKDILNEKPADVVISDMSPDISGNYTMDQARSIYLAGNALKIAEIFLKKNGSFLAKVFEGEDLKEFVDQMKASFKSINRFTPPASRKSSSEIYLIAKSLHRN